MEDIERILQSVKILARWIVAAGVLLVLILAHCWTQKQRIDKLEQDFLKLVIRKEYLRGQYENLKKDVLRVESNVTHYNARVLTMEREHERERPSNDDGAADGRSSATPSSPGRRGGR